MNNRPNQLRKVRKDYYDKLYSRYPALTKRLQPLLVKSDLIEDPLRYTEPKRKNKNRNRKGKNGKNKGNKKSNKRKSLRKGMNRFNDKIKRQRTKIKSNKKISEVRPDVLWGLR